MLGTPRFKIYALKDTTDGDISQTNKYTSPNYQLSPVNFNPRREVYATS